MRATKINKNQGDYFVWVVKNAQRALATLNKMNIQTEIGIKTTETTIVKQQ